MDAGIALTIGGAAGTLAKILHGYGMRGIWAALGTVGVSVISVGLYAVQAGNFGAATAFDYFLGWVSVLTTATAAFHGLEEAQKKMGDPQR